MTSPLLWCQALAGDSRGAQIVEQAANKISVPSIHLMDYIFFQPLGRFSVTVLMSTLNRFNGEHCSKDN